MDVEFLARCFQVRFNLSPVVLAFCSKHVSFIKERAKYHCVLWIILARCRNAAQAFIFRVSLIWQGILLGNLFYVACPVTKTHCAKEKERQPLQEPFE